MALGTAHRNRCNQAIPAIHHWFYPRCENWYWDQMICWLLAIIIDGFCYSMAGISHHWQYSKRVKYLSMVWSTSWLTCGAVLNDHAHHHQSPFNSLHITIHHHSGLVAPPFLLLVLAYTSIGQNTGTPWGTCVIHTPLSPKTPPVQGGEQLSIIGILRSAFRDLGRIEGTRMPRILGTGRSPQECCVHRGRNRHIKAKNWCKKGQNRKDAR